MDKRLITFNSELRAVGGPRPKIQGFIPYMSLSKRLFPDGPFERLMPGVFRDSLASGEPVLAFWGHDDRQPLGNTANGSLRLHEDGDGLSYEIFPDLEISWQADAYRSIKSGTITGTSFGFIPQEDNWTKEDGEEIREVTKAQLLEVSPVAFPAYPETQITARNYRSKNMDYKDKAQIEKRMKELSDREDVRGYLNAEEEEEYKRLETRMFEYEGQSRKDLEPVHGSVGRCAVLESVGGHSRHGGATIDLAKVFGLAKRCAYHCQRSSEREMALWNKHLVGGASVLTAEQRALFIDDPTQGGWLSAPEVFVAELIQATRNETVALDMCRVIPLTSSVSLGAPTLDAEPDDATWTSELRTGTEDTAMKIGKRNLHPHPLAKRLKVSKTLLRQAQIPVEEMVKEQLAYKLAVPIENGWFNGQGIDQPLGCMVASEYGIDTDRDVSTDNTATSIKADNLIRCKYTLKPQHRRNAKWAFHRDAISQIRRLKDGNGMYLWRSGFGGTPDTICELPFIESEYMPSTFTTGLYVGILGDWRNYWWAVSLNQQIQVLTELYAETNQNGYVSRSELDGMPVLSEAFVRVKLG
jgi:HK97 family phage major capsid protein/HK97 family phage prohead protease